MAVLASYLAGLCDYSDKLAAGERQSKVLLDYAEGTLELTPITKQLIASRTAEMLTLTTGITLEVRSASFRRIRGVTCVAVLADECAFWLSDESANPDVEILNAARPALAMTQGPLIAISSPYRGVARCGKLTASITGLRVIRRYWLPKAARATSTPILGGGMALVRRPNSEPASSRLTACRSSMVRAVMSAGIAVTFSWAPLTKAPRGPQ